MRLSTCNGEIFNYDGEDASLFIIIGLALALLIFFMYKMCRLCSVAFSYTHFHIHEAYKFYALTSIAIVTFLIFKISQLEYNYIRSDERKQDATPPTQYEIDGYRILNEIVGVISIYTMNMVYMLNGFTWLMISVGCDFTVETSSNRSAIFVEKHRKSAIRKKIRIAKGVTLYLGTPLMLSFSIIGTLKQTPDWCQAASCLILITNIMSVSLFLAVSIKFLKQRWSDPSVSRKTIIALVYLAVGVTLRETYALLDQITSDNNFVDDVLEVLYVILLTILPLLCMSYLAETQQAKEKSIRNPDYKQC